MLQFVVGWPNLCKIDSISYYKTRKNEVIVKIEVLSLNHLSYVVKGGHFETLETCVKTPRLGLKANVGDRACSRL